MGTHKRARLAGLLGAAVLVISIAAPVAAWEAEGGTKNCGSQTGKVHFRAKDWASAKAPGSSSTGIYPWLDGAWHVAERWGVDGGGLWNVVGDPNLDLVNTWAFCVAG